jgi:hypothetical protein
MKTSESISKIAPALLKAQQAITFASKSATNGHFKSKYADLPSVIDAVKPALNNEGISFIQSGSPSEDGRLHLTTRLLHTSGEWIEDTAVAALAKQDPQAFGSAMTYLRRYQLAAMTGIYQDDDDANEACAPVKKPPYPAESFQTNYPAWEKLVKSGGNTPQQIINTILAKSTLTADQQNAIHSLKIQTEQA